MAVFGSRQDVGIDGRTNASKVWEQTKVALRLVITYFNLTQAAFMSRNYSRTTSGVSCTSLDLERHCCLSHAFLTHNHLVAGRNNINGEFWAIVSDEKTTLQTFGEYELRFDIEESFLDDQSNGWNIPL